MKSYIVKNILPAALLVASAFGFTACVGDLDVDNINPKQTENLNQDALFTKIYANMVLTGQTGPDGSGDLDDIDEGTSSFIRQIWNANELPTDEAHCVWGDPGIPEFNHNAWSSEHPMMKALYYRIYFGITVANYFLQETEGDTSEKVLTQRAEARFMRAFYYSYLMDLYGNVPLITTVTKELQDQCTRANLFTWIEGELKDVIGEGTGNEILKDPAQRVAYGRADKAAAWLLLSRIYLNAEVYTGTPKWNEAKTYAQKILADGTYDLCRTGKGSYSPFQLLFMADNNENGAEKEIILPAIHDGLKTQTWGGSLFVIASVASDNDKVKDLYPYGTSENWGGNHCRKQFVKIFFPGNGYASDGTPNDNVVAAGDDRALFFTSNHTLAITKESEFKNGFAYMKFLNIYADGTKQPKHSQFVDVDFPMMRAAEAYLNIAEADARLNGGQCGTDGLNAIYELQNRAKSAYGTVTAPASFTLDQVCNEWAKEFAYEGRRRMDLIRFGKFGGQNNYRWEWMGGQENGTAFPAEMNLYAIPNTDLQANYKLKQNPGF